MRQTEHNPTPLVASELDKHFTNLIKCKTKLHIADSVTSYSVLDGYGNESGNISYLGQGEWRIFVDNFPSPKKYFATNLPIKSVQQFAADIERTGLKLTAIA